MTHWYDNHQEWLKTLFKAGIPMRLKAEIAKAYSDTEKKGENFKELDRVIMGFICGRLKTYDKE